jgi:hypothetical protein
VEKRAYHRLLEAAIAGEADFYRLGGGTGEDILQLVSHTS